MNEWMHLLIILVIYQIQIQIYKYITWNNKIYTERQKKQLFRAMPTKIYRIKMNDFWVNVSYSPPHYPHQKQRNWICQKWDKCLQITTSPFSKITETAPFPPHRLWNTSIAIHSNSIAGYVHHVHNKFALQQTYCEHDYGSRYWIWIQIQ